MNIAIIPARGGSKRIPRKNVRKFGGVPMISFAIKAAKESGLFERVVVSTDDPEIVEVAIDYGADVPFLRPAHLADDNTSTVPVIVHALGECERPSGNYDWVCCIYPAVPFIEVDDLVAARELAIRTGAPYCFPVTDYPSPVQRALLRSDDGIMEPMYPENELVRTQDLEVAYRDAGQFYWGRRDAWITTPRIHSAGAGLVIPNWRVVDIDTPDDWCRAELLYQTISERKA
jgi:pseudaminic acid cytidylyltransferase